MPNIASNTSPTEPQPAVQRTDHSRHGAFLSMARGLAWDVGLPVAAYYALHPEGLFIAAFVGLMVWNGWYIGRVLPGRA